MKLAQEFTSVTDVARIGNADDVEIRYSVFVGDPDLKFSFLDSERFICEDFTNYRDACNALELVKRTLELVDESLAQGLKLSDVRDEIIANLNRATTGNLISKCEAQRAVSEICGYYISHED